jgi:hypothetical protein
MLFRLFYNPEWVEYFARLKKISEILQSESVIIGPESGAGLLDKNSSSGHGNLL